jgi:ribosomal protein L11 methylase PrmA
MSWLELKLALGSLDAERVEEVLLEAGALSVTLEDAGDEPIYEPGAPHAARGRAGCPHWRHERGRMPRECTYALA